MSTQYYLGMMSGTSLDGVDVALVDFHAQPHVIATDFTPMPENLRQKITALVLSGETTLQALGELDHQLGRLYADCANRFLQKQNLPPQAIQAIGCHGQTVWHAPKGENPFTMQIGDMNLLAAKTGITVVGDFRRKDMAFGGQGAPLVPAFHQAVFADPQWATVVLNIGGISNISVLLPHQPVIGFDTGPGNTLLDQWIEQHQVVRYDKNGEWGEQGTVNTVLLSALLEESFFRLPPPKSTGRELFNLAWLQAKLEKIASKTPALSPQDVQATLVAFTVESIAQALDGIKSDVPSRLFVCGGGAKHPFIMNGLRERLPQWQVQTTQSMGFDVDYVEAAAFAWLAYRRMHHLPANLPSVTGAQSAVCLGAIFPKE